jgi:hypothetical protein
MGVGRLNIWVSDVADPCGTWSGEGTVTILDCDGVLRWPCGRFQTRDGQWQRIDTYANLPFSCGHLEVEVPPGCYWVIAGYVSPTGNFIHLNYTTHAGIVQVGCDETACVKVYNPTLRLCWDWFRTGLRMLAIERSPAPIQPDRVKEIERLVEEVMRDVPRQPIEETVEGIFDELVKSAGRKPPSRSKK